MSYGREPYYIYSDGNSIHFLGPSVDASVPHEALAQFVASMAARGDTHLNEWIQEGAALRPDTFSSNFRVKVRGGFKGHRRAGRLKKFLRRNK